MDQSNSLHRNKAMYSQSRATQTEHLLIFQDKRELYEFIRKYNHLLHFKDEGSQTECSETVVLNGNVLDNANSIRALIREELSRELNAQKQHQPIQNNPSLPVPHQNGLSSSLPLNDKPAQSFQETFSANNAQGMSSSPISSMSSSSTTIIQPTSNSYKKILPTDNGPQQSQLNLPPEVTESNSNTLQVPDHWLAVNEEKERSSLKIYQKLWQKKIGSNNLIFPSHSPSSGKLVRAMMTNNANSSANLDSASSPPQSGAQTGFPSRPRHRHFGRKFRERTQPFVCIPNHRTVTLRVPQDVRPTEPDEEFRIHKEDVSRVFQEACSIGNFGWRLASLLYTCDELWDRNWGGTHGKRPLSPRRLHAIEHVFYDYFPPEKQVPFLNEGRAAINQGVRNLMYGHAGKYIQFSTPASGSSAMPITSNTGQAPVSNVASSSATGTGYGSEEEAWNSSLKRSFATASSCWDSGEGGSSQLLDSQISQQSTSDLFASFSQAAPNPNETQNEDQQRQSNPLAFLYSKRPLPGVDWPTSNASVLATRRENTPSGGMPPSTRYNLLSPVGGIGSTQWSSLSSGVNLVPAHFQHAQHQLQSGDPSHVVNLVEDEDTEDTLHSPSASSLFAAHKFAHGHSMQTEDVKPVILSNAAAAAAAAAHSSTSSGIL